MRKRDLTGMVFGSLRVVDEAELYVSPNGYRKTMWNCECDCGNRCVAMGSHLLSGHTSSCGCQQKAKLKPREARDLTGQKFGMLTVVSRMPNRMVGTNSRVVWHCVCDCGMETDVLALLLKEGQIKSCGCLSISHAERVMTKYLADHGADFKTEYGVDGLIGVNGGALRFDFALFSNSALVLLIELNGEQHYRPVRHFGGMSKYEAGQNNDARKRSWAADAGIPLIEIDVSQCSTDADFVSAYDRALESYHFPN